MPRKLLIRKAIHSGTGFAFTRAMDHTKTTQRKAVGRPSTVTAYEALLAQWLRANPGLSGAEILRRARHSGYQGGKSALYELIRRTRVQ